MSSTYVVQEAIDIVGSTAVPGKENLHTAADLALRYLWNEHAWHKTLADLPPFFLIPNRRDYGAPFSAVPSDFDKLHEAWLVYSDLDTNNGRVRDIEVKSHIWESDWEGTVWPTSAIAYIPELSVFRLSSIVPNNIGAPNYWIAGRYKKTPTKITGANASSTTIPWDDLEFPMFVETVRWKLMMLNGDPRAGSIQVFGTGQRQYSGQAAIVHDLINQAIEREQRGSGPETIWPEQSLTDW